MESSMFTELLSSNADIWTNKPWFLFGSRSQRFTADITLRLIDPVSLTFTVFEPANRKIGLRFLCFRPGRTMSYTSIWCRTWLTFLIWFRLNVISASRSRSFSGIFEMLKNRRNLLWYLKRLSMLLSANKETKCKFISETALKYYEKSINSSNAETYSQSKPYTHSNPNPPTYGRWERSCVWLVYYFASGFPSRHNVVDTANVWW